MMTYKISRYLSIVIISCIGLTTVACRASDSDQDIPPIESIEIEAVPETIVTEEPAPAPTASPAEPVEPISPVSPVKEPTMPPPSKHRGTANSRQRRGPGRGPGRFI